MLLTSDIGNTNITLGLFDNEALVEEYRLASDKDLSLEEYADILCDCVEVLSPEVVVHRLTGDPPKKFLLSPMWSADKKHVLNEINRSFELRDVVQGKNFTKKTQCP